jgi:predicted dithiol-disulfide oxidoreductase (DUF899 family)
MTANIKARPRVVSQAEWQLAHKNFLAKGKAATQTRDALAAERRRLPRVKVEKDYLFEGPNGRSLNRRVPK